MTWTQVLGRVGRTVKGSGDALTFATYSDTVHAYGDCGAYCAKYGLGSAGSWGRVVGA